MIANAALAIPTPLRDPASPNLTIANDVHSLSAPVRIYPYIHHAVVMAEPGAIAVGFKQEEGKNKELGRVGAGALGPCGRILGGGDDVMTLEGKL